MTLEFSETGRLELFAAMAKAQSSMGDVIKRANNPAFRSKYADLAACVEAVLPALNQHGLALLQSPTFNGDLVSIETVIVHAAGGTMRSSIAIKPAKQDAHGIGSAITYGRRYSLMALCGVAPEDDDGNAAPGRGPMPMLVTGSAEVSAAKAALDQCRDHEALKAWKRANETALQAMTGPEHDAVSGHYKQRWRTIAATSSAEAA